MRIGYRNWLTLDHFDLVTNCLHVRAVLLAHSRGDGRAPKCDYEAWKSVVSLENELFGPTTKAQLLRVVERAQLARSPIVVQGNSLLRLVSILLADHVEHPKFFSVQSIKPDSVAVFERVTVRILGNKLICGCNESSVGKHAFEAIHSHHQHCDQASCVRMCYLCIYIFHLA